jgi:hypothetical protein
MIVFNACGTMGSGLPDESVKNIAQNVDQYFCVKIFITITVEKIE